MSNKKDFKNKCFSPNWLEVDLDEIQARQQKEVIEISSSDYDLVYSSQKKEERLESKRRKDLNTLLRELDEIRQNIEKAAEKQRRLANLMGFYSEELVQ